MPIRATDHLSFNTCNHPLFWPGRGLCKSLIINCTVAVCEHSPRRHSHMRPIAYVTYAYFAYVFSNMHTFTSHKYIQIYIYIYMYVCKGVSVLCCALNCIVIVFWHSNRPYFLWPYFLCQNTNAFSRWPPPVARFTFENMNGLFGELNLLYSHELIIH